MKHRNQTTVIIELEGNLRKAQKAIGNPGS